MCGAVVGKKSDRQATRSTFFSDMRHRHGLKVNCSAGDRAITVMMKGCVSAGLSARESVHFYLSASLKGDSAGLAWKTTASRGLGERAMRVQGLCSAWESVCVGLYVCCGSVRRLLVCALVAELFIMQWPFTPITTLVKDERHLFL